MDVTKDGWKEQLRIFKRTINANDEDLRSFTLGAIRALAKRENSLDAIRSTLAALDEFLSES